MGGPDSEKKQRAVVMGASAGGGETIRRIISALGPGYGLPIFIVQHLFQSDDGMFADGLQHRTALKVNVPCDKDRIKAGEIFVAPANYHMLVERDGTVALSIEEKVNYSRPSIDVLFESAVYVWGSGVVGILLTGSNNDGTEGLRAIREAGGLTVAQDPFSAEYPFMPQSAIDAGAAELVLVPEEIAGLLVELGTESRPRPTSDTKRL